jgi:hypothetical protein
VPLVFPVEHLVPETRRHLLVRTALFESVRDAFGDRVTVGSEQFVYWDPTDPRQCCAPDVFVRAGQPDADFDSWKVWERGAPQLAVEIVSPSDESDRQWDAKLDRFRRLGVAELVRFDPGDADRPLRIWDHVGGDLCERDPADAGFARCATLGAYFCVRDEPDTGPALRLARNAAGTDLYPTRGEARQREAEGRQREAEGRQREAEARQREAEGRQREAEARQRAEQRLADLEAEIGRRPGR